MRPWHGSRAGPSESRPRGWPWGKSRCRLRRPELLGSASRGRMRGAETGQTRRVLPDPALDDAVREFCDAMTPRVRELADSVTGVDGTRIAVDVQVEAYNLAAALE